MKIHVKYYAAVRDIIGLSKEDIDVEEDIQLGSFVKIIKECYCDIKDLVILVAVNEKYSKPDKILTEGDRVALFPPVSGG